MKRQEEINQELTEATKEVESAGQIYRAALEAEKTELENKSLNVRDFFLGVAFLAAKGELGRAEEIFEQILVASGGLYEQRHDFFTAIECRDDLKREMRLGANPQ